MAKGKAKRKAKAKGKKKKIPRKLGKKIPKQRLLRSELIDTFFANTFEYDKHGRLVVTDLVFQQKIEALMAQGHTVYITVASPVYVVDNGKDIRQPSCTSV